MSAATPSRLRQAIGIDGYPRGWIAAMVTADGIEWMTADVDAIAALCPPDAVIGIDIPVGLADHGLRECDTAAQAHLGAAASSVFTTPPRGVLDAHVAPDATAERTQRLSRELSGQGTTPLALALARRILAVDTFASTHAGLVEVHPECSFRAMAPTIEFTPKSSARGAIQRMDAIAAWVPGLHEVLASAPPRVPLEDALDALAALWSAVRWRDGLAHTLPGDAIERPFIAI